MTKSLAKLSLLLVVAALSACGFHLRGAAELPPELSPMTVSGLSEQEIMRRELEQLIGGGDSMVMVPTSDGAKSVLRILKRDPGKRVLTVNSRGKVVEYEISEHIEFDLVDAANKSLIDRQAINVARAYTNTEEIETLGKQGEEELIREDIQRDLAAQIVRRLQAKLRR